MKALFVYKYLTLGGVEAVLRARIDDLARWGIEAHAWFLEDLGGRPLFGGCESRVRVGDVAAFLEFLGAGGFDLVSSIDTEEVLTEVAGRRAGARLVVECHSTYAESLDYVRRLPAVRPDAIFTPSEHQRRIVRVLTRDQCSVRVVPNALQREFVAAPSYGKLALRRRILAWIGRLDELKNWRGFLDLAGLLRRRGADLDLWLAGRPGDPASAAELLEHAKQVGVLGCLRWWCGLPHERMPAFLDAVRESAGVVVSTSRAESFGMTIAEAMARECAVVVPDGPPATEFVEHRRTGCLYSPGIEPAADCVEALLADRELRESCGRRARQAVLARFAPEPALAVLAAELWAVTTGGHGGRPRGGEPTA